MRHCFNICQTISSGRQRAFTLIELLVAMGVLALMSVMMLNITNSSQNISRQTTKRVEQFREARRAFERLNAHLAQATLNVYYDYADANGKPRAPGSLNFTPSRYLRMSELRFLLTRASALTAPRGGTLVGRAIFFNAPIGKTDNSDLAAMNSLVNTVGYFVEKSSDSSWRPPTMPAGTSRVRYRLFEMLEPAENLTIYKLTSGPSGNAMSESEGWFKTPLATADYSRPLADNIVSLVLQAIYRDANGSVRKEFDYNSQPRGGTTQAIEENNLPSHMRVVMIAIDESAGQRVDAENISLPNAIDDTTLTQLETALVEKNLNFRRFESTIAIGPARWSAQ